MQKKKKKTLVIISILLGAVVLIGGSFWLGKVSAKSQLSSSKNNQSPSDNSEIQQLKLQLNTVKNQLNNLTNDPQKNQLEDTITALENKVKNLINPDKSTIRQLKQEIKEIREKLENNDKPDRNPPPTGKTEIKLRYVGEADNEEVAFNNFFGKQNREDLRLFYISRNHPQIKELMSQGKLQFDRAFIARYGKVDHISPNNLMYTFNENNQELEIREA